MNDLKHLMLFLYSAQYQEINLCIYVYLYMLKF